MAITEVKDVKGYATHHELTEDVAISNQVDILELDAIEQTPTGKFVWLVTLTASIAGALFGYDTGNHLSCSRVSGHRSRWSNHELGAEGSHYLTMFWWRLLWCHNGWSHCR